jgi:hypothetical protein
MIKLSLERINAKSPYEVKEAGGGYEFRTEGGILYRFRFLAENPIGGCDTYQFAIAALNASRSAPLLYFPLRSYPPRHPQDVSANHFLSVLVFVDRIGGGKVLHNIKQK